MDRNYLPVLILLGFVAANAVLMLALSHFTLDVYKRQTRGIEACAARHTSFFRKIETRETVARRTQLQ